MFLPNQRALYDWYVSVTSTIFQVPQPYRSSGCFDHCQDLASGLTSLHEREDRLEDSLEDSLKDSLEDSLEDSQDDSLECQDLAGRLTSLDEGEDRQNPG